MHGQASTVELKILLLKNKKLKPPVANVLPVTLTADPVELIKCNYCLFKISLQRHYTFIALSYLETHEQLFIHSLLPDFYRN